MKRTALYTIFISYPLRDDGAQALRSRPRLLKGNFYGVIYAGVEFEHSDELLELLRGIYSAVI